jgi:hypothetical protein
MLNNLSYDSSILAGVFPARVRLSILDDKTNKEAFSKFGEWSSIGCIFFDKISNKIKGKSYLTSHFAKPLFPNLTQIPVHNELVYIISLPDANIQDNINNISYYYFQPINIWNNAHHNAIPHPTSIDSNQIQDYNQTEVGLSNKVNNKNVEIDLGETFKERLNIKNIQPYEGDIIYQGRWGQSLRFGSTVKAKIKNTWSDKGEEGDPITIIRNGQYEDEKDSWIPQVEDINKDVSSIYITSTQKLPIKVASNDYKSYSTKPTSPDQYNESQIVLNSGRLLLNSKTDSILLSSAKTINLNSRESVNVDSKKTIVNSKEVLLGDKNASESVILGDKFLDDLSSLLTTLVSLGNALSTPIGTGVPGVVNPSIPAPAAQITVKANRMLNKIQQYKSKTTKTK